jgi:hypothetical protein
MPLRHARDIVICNHNSRYGKEIRGVVEQREEMSHQALRRAGSRVCSGLQT